MQEANQPSNQPTQDVTTTIATTTSTSRKTEAGPVRMWTPRKVTTMTTTRAWLWSAGVVLGLLLYVPSALAGYEHSCNLQSRNRGSRRGTCGRNLADMVQLVCLERGGVSSGGPNHKRDVGQQVGAVASSGSDDDDAREEGTLRGLVLNRRQALSYLPRKKRSPPSALGYFRNLPKRASFGVRGIVCECCVHRCTFGELAQYCVL